MQKNKVSIVIPIFASNHYRKNNFLFTISKLVNNVNNSEIIIVEHKSNILCVSDEVKNFKNVKCITRHNESVFNKSKLINCAIEKIESKYTWILDCDLYTDYSYIERFICNSDFDLVKPFSKVVFMNEQQSSDCIKTGYFHAKGKLSTNSEMGKFSFIVKTDILKSVGGFDESYEGWGFQDLDIIKRIKKSFFISTTYIDKPACHLFHPSSKSHQYEFNKKKYYLSI